MSLFDIQSQLSILDVSCVPIALRWGRSHVPWDKSSGRDIEDDISDLPAASESGIVVYDQPPQGSRQARLRRQDGKPVLHHQLKQPNSLTQQRINLLAPGATMKDLPKHLQHPSFNRKYHLT